MGLFNVNHLFRVLQFMETSISIIYILYGQWTQPWVNIMEMFHCKQPASPLLGALTIKGSKKPLEQKRACRNLNSPTLKNRLLHSSSTLHTYQLYPPHMPLFQAAQTPLQTGS